MEDREILLALGRLEGKMDSIIRTNEALTDNFGRHDKRIRALENGRATFLGACGLGAAFISWAVTFISNT